MEKSVQNRSQEQEPGRKDPQEWRAGRGTGLEGLQRPVGLLSIFRWFAVAALFFLSAGCIGQPIPPPSNLPQKEEVLSRLVGRRHLESFRSVVLIEVQLANSEETASPIQELIPEGGEFFSGKAVLLWSAPDSLRMEILSPFGSPVFVAAAKGNQIRALSILRGRYYVGSADRKTMMRWLGLPVSVRLMVRLLQGKVPDLENQETLESKMEWDGTVGALRVKITPKAGARRQEVVFLEPSRLEPIRAQLEEDQGRLEVRYGTFLKFGSEQVPSWTEIRDLKGGHRLRIEVEEKTFQPPGKLPEDLFHLQIPRGSIVIPLFRGKN